jgi:hypothetical protein
MADVRETTMFKEVPEGFVFRAPNPWVFGRARFYLANAAQKAELLSIITARSQAIFWIALIGLIAAGTALMAFASGHDDPTMGDAFIMLALLPVWLYAALLISIRPMARRLEPVLAGLPRTEQKITAVELRQAMGKTMSLPQSLMIAVSHGLLAISFAVMVIEKVHGRASIFEDGGALALAFAAVAFAFSEICFTMVAIAKARNASQDGDGQDGSVAAGGALRRNLLPVFSLVMAVGLLGFVVTTAAQKYERTQKTASIQTRLDNLKLRTAGSRISERQADLKVRIEANTTRMAGLVERFNSPRVKCETVAPTDDPARLQAIEACRDRARAEQDAIQRDIATATQEARALAQENEAIKSEVTATRAEIDAIQLAIDANRR